MLIYEEPKYYRVTLEYKNDKIYERILKFTRPAQIKDFKRKIRKSKYILKYNFERVHNEYDNEMIALKNQILSQSKKIPFNQYFIYALIKNKEIVYIGQSLNIMARLGTHIQEGVKDFDSYAIVCKADESNVDIIEQKYIDDLKPKYNIVHNRHNSSYIRNKKK